MDDKRKRMKCLVVFHELRGFRKKKKKSKVAENRNGNNIQNEGKAVKKDEGNVTGG